jgi:hypothetical protein
MVFPPVLSPFCYNTVSYTFIQFDILHFFSLAVLVRYLHFYSLEAFCMLKSSDLRFFSQCETPRNDIVESSPFSSEQYCSEHLLCKVSQNLHFYSVLSSICFQCAVSGVQAARFSLFSQCPHNFIGRINSCGFLPHRD